MYVYLFNPFKNLCPSQNVKLNWIYEGQKILRDHIILIFYTVMEWIIQFGKAHLRVIFACKPLLQDNDPGADSICPHPTPSHPQAHDSLSTTV